MSIIQQFSQYINQNITFSSLSSIIGNMTTNIHESLFIDAIKTLDDNYFKSNF